MRQNKSIYNEATGKYATNLFTDYAVKIIKTHDQETPLFLYLSHLAPHSANWYDLNQAPANEIEKFSYIKDPLRRKYAAMVSILDTGVGKIVQALHESNMLDNSVIVFLSDNGAPVQGENMNAGSNLPLRGVSINILNSLLYIGSKCPLLWTISLVTEKLFFLMKLTLVLICSRCQCRPRDIQFGYLY